VLTRLQKAGLVAPDEAVVFLHSPDYPTRLGSVVRLVTERRVVAFNAGNSRGPLESATWADVSAIEVLDEAARACRTSLELRCLLGAVVQVRVVRRDRTEFVVGLAGLDASQPFVDALRSQRDRARGR